MMENCPFCELPKERVLAANKNAFAIADIAPVSAGHCLIIPFRHIKSIEELQNSEWADIGTLMRQVRTEVSAQHSPDGFNIGINNGIAAGQTVMHLHVHLIPRYQGDCASPAGGIRRLLPGEGDWRER